MSKQKQIAVKVRRQVSIRNTILHKYGREVCKFKQYCEEQGIPYMTFEQAEPTDVCVLSMVDYDIGDMRQDFDKDNKSYFLHPNDYETWKFDNQ